MGIANSLAAPAVVIRPILSAPVSVNHSAPSGPTASPVGALSSDAVGNSVIVPLVVMRPILERARLDLPSPNTHPPDRHDGLEESLGLTSREAEVLNLIARGYTNREIAEALVISVKTASVHVSHILAKLDAPNRREAAAIAHRISPPPLAR